MSPQEALQTLDGAAAEQVGNRRFHDMVKKATEVLREALSNVEADAKAAGKDVGSEANKIEVRVEDDVRKLTGHEQGAENTTVAPDENQTSAPSA